MSFSLILIQHPIMNKRILTYLLIYKRAVGDYLFNKYGSKAPNGSEIPAKRS